MRYTALQQMKEDDPLVQALVKILRKANRVTPYLQKNLNQQTARAAEQLQQAAKETVAAYGQDWEQYGASFGNLAEVSNDLRDLDEEADRLIEFMDDLYNNAIELELQADQKDYPENHLVFQFVQKIEELLNLRMD